MAGNAVEYVHGNEKKNAKYTSQSTINNKLEANITLRLQYDMKAGREI